MTFHLDMRSECLSGPKILVFVGSTCVKYNAQDCTLKPTPQPGLFILGAGKKAACLYKYSRYVCYTRQCIKAKFRGKRHTQNSVSPLDNEQRRAH